MSVYDKYKAVIGLECHIQLLTKTKMYSSDVAEYGAMPNTNVSVISLGHPGTLPMVNKSAIEFAVRLGLAVNAQIRYENQFARKNYFYADLPKGYQITQDKTPICTGGHIDFEVNGQKKRVNLTRIHLEEDAGKSIHDIDPYFTLVDLNRAGVPLIEIVSEPDVRSGDEAMAYLSEIQKLVRYLGICDGNMEEGSMRCDANISVRLKGEKKLGTKVEVKNLNSIRNVKRAIDFEARRLIVLLEEGTPIQQQTRSFDAAAGTTFALRSKEEANDYRYFADPDLPPFEVTKETINAIRKALPPLPEQLVSRYMQTMQLSEYDARVICDDRETIEFFE